MSQKENTPKEKVAPVDFKKKLPVGLAALPATAVSNLSS
jgi:hypothetical protein